MWTISGEYGEACGWKRCRTDCGRNKCFVVGNIGKRKQFSHVAELFYIKVKILHVAIAL